MKPAKRSMRNLALIAPALALLGGCAQDGSRFPSLAIRDAERVSGTAQPVEPQEPAETDPVLPTGLTDRLAALGEQARESHATFLSRAARARSATSAAAGAPKASDRWAEAIVAFSDVESARSDTMFALAELDSMLANGAVTQADSGEEQGLLSIVATRAEVAELVAQEDAVLDELAAPIAP